MYNPTIVLCLKYIFEFKLMITRNTFGHTTLVAALKIILRQKALIKVTRGFQCVFHNAMLLGYRVTSYVTL